MNRVQVFFFLLSLVSGYSGLAQNSAPKVNIQRQRYERLHQFLPGKLKAHAHSLKQYAASQNASTQIGILVDMSLPSWKKRFFVVDLETDSILVSGLCAQGKANDVDREEIVFSNVPGSNCTSEGRYKIGPKYIGEYGLAYKLYGLDSSNCNAYQRIIVLHYYPKVSDFEDSKVCRSNGCPMVSPSVFKLTSEFLDSCLEPVLMWIYR